MYVNCSLESCEEFSHSAGIAPRLPSEKHAASVMQYVGMQFRILQSTYYIHMWSSTAAASELQADIACMPRSMIFPPLDNHCGKGDDSV